MYRDICLLDREAVAYMGSYPPPIQKVGDDLLAGGEPDVVVAPDMGERPVERADPVGEADDVGVERDRCDAPRDRALGMEHIEGAANHAFEIVSGEAAPLEGLLVGDARAVGHRDDRSARDLHRHGLVESQSTT